MDIRLDLSNAFQPRAHRDLDGTTIDEQPVVQVQRAGRPDQGVRNRHGARQHKSAGGKDQGGCIALQQAQRSGLQGNGFEAEDALHGGGRAVDQEGSGTARSGKEVEKIKEVNAAAQLEDAAFLDGDFRTEVRTQTAVIERQPAGDRERVVASFIRQPQGHLPGASGKSALICQHRAGFPNQLGLVIESQGAGVREGDACRHGERHALNERLIGQIKVHFQAQRRARHADDGQCRPRRSLAADKHPAAARQFAVGPEELVGDREEDRNGDTPAAQAKKRDRTQPAKVQNARADAGRSNDIETRLHDRAARDRK